MLVLSRRVGETVRIGDGVAVRVLGVKGNQVRLGIEAPEDVLILREEIADGVDPEKSAVGGAKRRSP